MNFKKKNFISLKIGIVLIACVALIFPKGSTAQSGAAFYAGFSMGQVWRTSSGTVTGQIGANATGVNGSLSGAVTGTRYDCCLPSNSSSACNFNNENAICKSGIIRPAHTKPVDPLP